MVVALVGEDDAVPLAVDLAEIDDPGVFHRTDHDVGPGGGQMFLQVRAAAFIRTVFAPHGVEQGHLGQGGVPAQQGGHFPGFAGRQGQAVFLEKGRQGRIVITAHVDGREAFIVKSHGTPAGKSGSVAPSRP